MDYDKNTLDQLLLEIEQTYGNPIILNKDFSALSEAILKSTHSLVSPTTLKRYFGKKDAEEYKHKNKNMSILNVLATYVGYKDFASFERQEKDNPSRSSHEIHSVCINSSDLSDGEEIILTWTPDRKVRIRHIKGNSFVVLTSDNSKLSPSDTFDVETIRERCPLILRNLHKGSLPTCSYICAQDCSLEIELVD